MGCKSECIPRTGLIFTILINHASSQELVIYSEVIISCFNHSLTDSLTTNTQQFGEEAPPPRQGPKGIASSSSRRSWEVTDDSDMVVFYDPI